jgi:hypothetical protein
MDDSTDRKPMHDEAIPDSAREHMREARRELRESMNSLFPPEFVQHRRRARREMLLAWRSFLDRAIQRIDGRIDEDEAGAREDRTTTA